MLSYSFNQTRFPRFRVPNIVGFLPYLLTDYGSLVTMKITKSQIGTDPKSRSTVPQPDRKSVLLLVHLQNDFCPGGARWRFRAVMQSFHWRMRAFSCLAAKGFPLSPHGIGIRPIIVRSRNRVDHGHRIVCRDRLVRNSIQN